MADKSAQTGIADEILYGSHQRHEKGSRFADQLAEELYWLPYAERAVLKILNASDQTNVSLSSVGIAQIIHGDSVCIGDDKHLEVSQILYKLEARDWARHAARMAYHGCENHLWQLVDDGIEAARRLFGER